MVDSIALTEATRFQLQQVQQVAAIRQDANEALSSGLRVQSATDDPVDFFRANALSERAQDLFAAKDSLGQGLSSIEASLVGLDAIEDLAQQLRGLALSATGSSPDQRAAIAEQFDLIRDQITAIAGDTTFGGNSLISTDAVDLQLQGSDAPGNVITIEGLVSDAATLGISASVTFNDFATAADIEAAISQIDSAIVEARNNAQRLGSEAAAVQIQEDFIDNITNTLETGAANLVNADINQTAAELLSAQIREELGLTSLGLTTRNEQLVVGLLG